MRGKWRPNLAIVLGGALCGTLGLSFAGLVVLRYLGPEIGFRNAAMLLAVIIALLTGSLGWLLVRLLLRPITELQRFATSARVTLNNPVSPPTHFGTRELQATALSVMDMAETLRNRETTIRSFSDHISHELKTPVAVIRAATELLQEGGTLDPQDLKLVDQIAGASDQMEQHLHAMRLVVKAREVRYIGMSRLRDLEGDLGGRFPQTDIRMSGGTVPVPLAREGLEIVLGHLIDNAAAHDATFVTIKATVTQDATRLVIRDDGGGISEGNAGRIFDPFFTTKRAQGGTGMGLSIVQSLLRAHGGDITTLPAQKGTVFEIAFPTY